MVILLRVLVLNLHTEKIIINEVPLNVLAESSLSVKITISTLFFYQLFKAYDVSKELNLKEKKKHLPGNGCIPFFFFRSSWFIVFDVHRKTAALT